MKFAPVDQTDLVFGTRYLTLGEAPIVTGQQRVLILAFPSERIADLQFARCRLIVAGIAVVSLLFVPPCPGVVADLGNSSVLAAHLTWLTNEL